MGTTTLTLTYNDDGPNDLDTAGQAAAVAAVAMHVLSSAADTREPLGLDATRRITQALGTIATGTRHRAMAG